MPDVMGQDYRSQLTRGSEIVNKFWKNCLDSDFHSSFPRLSPLHIKPMTGITDNLFQPI